MSVTTIQAIYKVGGVLTDPDGSSVLLSSNSGLYGVKRTDTDAVVVADGAAMTRISTGVYQYAITDPAYDLTYEYSVEAVVDGNTIREVLYKDGTVTPASGSLGWITEAQADAYFAERLEADSWSASGVDKSAAITTAYHDLLYCQDFDYASLDDLASGEDFPTALKVAQYEQILFRLNDPDMDLRSSIQAQGVKAAGIVKETYAGAGGERVPIAPAAREALSDGGYVDAGADTFEITR